MIHKIREVTAEEENFHLEKIAPGISIIRRDHMPLLGVGDYIACVYRITEVNRDCDGSALYDAVRVDSAGIETGAELHSLGVYPETEVRLDDPKDIFDIAR